MGLEKQDRIDRYIREEMTSAEREAFERDLKADQALSGLYEESRLIAHAIRDVAADRELMAIMRNASADEIRSVIGKERRLRQRWLWWAIGSVAALLLVAVVMRITLYTSSSSSQMDTLYQTYYEPFSKRPGLSRGALGEADALKDKAYGLYMAGDYASAAELYDRLSPDAETLFYAALCYLEREKPEQAIVRLETLVEMGDQTPYYQMGIWYWAMACLKAHQKAEAISLLRRIVAEDGFYADKAAELLGKMR